MRELGLLKNGGMFRSDFGIFKGGGIKKVALLWRICGMKPVASTSFIMAENVLIVCRF